MSRQSHYVTLGVQPDAEGVVVTAAYRALAQRYHPDRWSGDKSYATERMSAINEAYRVLGNPALRTEYDDSLRSSGGREAFANDTDDTAEAFDAALAAVEARWQTACEVFPDLVDLRASLARYSTNLAFAFVTALLEKKAFPMRAKLAHSLETSFLQRYFGKNQQVMSFARSLLLDGNRAAAQELNMLVDVLGSEVDPELLIGRIKDRFDLGLVRPAREYAKLDPKRVEVLRQRLRARAEYDDAVELATLLGHTVKERLGGLFGNRVEVQTIGPGGIKLDHRNSANFIAWVRFTLVDPSAD